MADRPLGKHFLRAWRKHRGLSLRQLAERMEIEPGVPLMSHANLGRIETGEQPYTQDLMEALSDALGVSVPMLIEVNPEVDGQVIDLMRLLRDKDPATVSAFLLALPSRK
jgi:transcriptional regulator with XRE-family HTH domain